MALGPGKYDDACTAAGKLVGVTKERGGGVILIVLGGNHGNGFSCQADLATTLALPDILETLAAELRRDLLG
ncbi:hypothetical protein IVA80_15380 [Bradyrhizobium sp. 139]|uniref:hypothetical protein n=1 Tax=Bradyrhizobium sp. 139 TaxID=2782616 RepID=UPI001FF9F8E5|nr:hypothetical protein [Bradyrhizobium sp. 139]MCK1742206.1 hypothetical protein [Bradyrhizobium sp. 139]